MVQPRSRGMFFSALLSNCCRVTVVLLILAAPAIPDQGKRHTNVICREQLSSQLRGKLATNLKKITGWPNLGFSDQGALQVGIGPPTGGSKTARDLILSAINGPNYVVLEDASNRPDVVFCRVVSAKFVKDTSSTPRVYVVLIDFADFDQLMGDRPAREAFNVGWGVLHELEHVANDSKDAETIGETGECEARINEMRREVGLPERAEYFFSFFPLTESSDFKTRFVRLSFVQQLSVKKTKRYWLIWDADLVGGIGEREQIAVLQ
jgi:hypothetical protein